MAFYVDRYRSIPEAFFALADSLPDRLVYEQAIPRREADADEATPRLRRGKTYSDIRSRVIAGARFLRSLESHKKSGTERHRIAIISNTRPEWMEADLAILTSGAVTVAVYHSLSDEEVAYILYDSGAGIVFAENVEQVSKLQRIQERSWTIPATEDRPSTEVQLSFQMIIAFETVPSHPGVRQWEELISQHTPAEEKAPDLASIAPNDLATLVYTSGTTGPPKGVMQTHRNHLANIRQVYEAGIVQQDSTVFLFLPLAHSFARLMGMIGFLTPVKLLFPAVFSTEHSRLEPRSLLRDMRDLGAQVVPIVPRFLEKMEEGIRSRAARSSIEGRLVRFALSVAESSYEQRMAQRSPGTTRSLLFRSTARVRRAIRESLFGPDFRFAVSGGAKLSLSVARFFQAMEIPVLEGYGLTETCVATNFNPLGRNKLGTVGPVLAKDIEQRIDEDGEICFRGPNVSMGYWLRPTATKASRDADGWFHTGDLGSIDDDGYLSIVGRKKDIIVTSGGKKIAPQAIEDRLRAHPGISQVVLIGDGRPFCVALFTLNSAPSAETAESVHSALAAHVGELNKQLASFETVKNFHILPEDFSIENGLLTPTMKVKRKLVEQRFAQEIEDLYVRTKKS